mmetsp:Transcript_11052/g.31744  ORF Transcript_11052/g.31744 Transcript_11052/m.31744 type:complete len:510 (+) Transcript_11052:260-1789(+)
MTSATNQTSLVIDRTERSHPWLAKVTRIVVPAIAVQAVNATHLGRREVKVKDVAVFAHARRRAGLCQSQRVALHRPPDEDLRCRFPFRCCDVAYDRILQQHVVLVGHAEFDVGCRPERGERRDPHPGLLSKSHEFGLAVLRMQLDLQRRWADATRAQDLAQELRGKVAHADIASDLPGIHQTFHRLPGGAHVVGNEHHLAVHVGPFRRVLLLDGNVLHGNREMDEVLVDVIELQILERFLQCQRHMVRVVIRVPQFGRDEQILPRHDAILYRTCDALSHLHLVAVVAGAVQTTVPGLDGLVAHVGAFVIGHLPKSKDERVVGLQRPERRVVGQCSNRDVGGSIGQHGRRHNITPNAGQHTTGGFEGVARMHHKLILDGKDVARLPVVQNAIGVHEIRDALQDVGRHGIHVAKSQRILGIGIATVDPSQKGRDDGIGKRPLVHVVGPALSHEPDGGHGLRRDADQVVVAVDGPILSQPPPCAAVDLGQLLLQLLLRCDLPGVLPRPPDRR